jgi:bifunctional aspartokinase / homoserine dehydrogenase 1
VEDLNQIPPPNPNPAPALVMKFGGTSIGSAEAMRRTVDIIRDSRATWPRLVVVVSALATVTDLLLDSAAHASAGELQAAQQAEKRLLDLHNRILAELVPDPSWQALALEGVQQLVNSFAELCRAICVLGEATPRALDAIASTGERLCVRVLAAALESAGTPAQYVDATRLIQTDRVFQRAHPDFAATARQARQVLEPVFDRGQVAVVTGFIGATPEGVTTTLGRGGSDYSAAILGASLPASEVWIWTDVDGVMTADPRSNGNARSIPELSFREISELAYFGAKVLHPKTIQPVIEAGLGLRICNTFHPNHPGTRIIANGENSRSGEIKAVTAIHHQRLITIEGRGMLGVPGVAARAFGAVASTGTSVPLITQASSEQSICFAVPAESAVQVLEALKEVFSLELAHRDIDRIWATGEVVIVTAVGAGMRQTIGVAGRLFSAIGERGVNVIAIAQGSSEVSISLVVEDHDAPAAVQALHDLIINGRPGDE